MISSAGEAKEENHRVERRGSQPSCCDTVAPHDKDGVPTGGQPVEVDGVYEFSGLGYDYLSSDWYELPVAARKDRWSPPYFDAGGGNIWMVTYSVPFWNGGQVGGIITIDLEFSHSLRAAFAPKDAFEESLSCYSCGLTCEHSYHSCDNGVDAVKLCNRCVDVPEAKVVECVPQRFECSSIMCAVRFHRCFDRGLLPASIAGQDLVHHMSGTADVVVLVLV
jgi:hypothetical protein